MEIPKPSMLRNYLYEYVLIALTIAIVFLTYELLDLNKFVRDNLMKELSTSTEAVNKSTDVMRSLLPKTNLYESGK